MTYTPEQLYEYFIDHQRIIQAMPGDGYLVVYSGGKGDDGNYEYFTEPVFCFAIAEQATKSRSGVTMTSDIRPLVNYPMDGHIEFADQESNYLTVVRESIASAELQMVVNDLAIPLSGEEE